MNPDSPQFIARIAANYRRFHQLGRFTARAHERGFDRAAAIGEDLLKVQEARPREFSEWFSLNREQLGFEERTAERFKSVARDVRKLGLAAAKAAHLGDRTAGAARPPAQIGYNQFRVPKDIAHLEPEKAVELFERLSPIYTALADRVATIPR